eukprot:GEMP01075320.1.p1 GENE.GEMP01075320.1~~GEMP01075320.1.p1  ORF type:complete len:179 (+),score=33.87 GEMP01075320.1:35-571(+)
METGPPGVAEPPVAQGLETKTKWAILVKKHHAEAGIPAKIQSLRSKEVDLHRTLEALSANLSISIRNCRERDFVVKKLNKSASAPIMSLDYVNHHKFGQSLRTMRANDRIAQSVKQEKEKNEGVVNLKERISRFRAAGLAGSHAIPNMDKWFKTYGKPMHTNWNNWASNNPAVKVKKF